jgi:hypothetical protein
VPDRVAFNAIVLVLVTGIAWRFVRSSWAALGWLHGGDCVTGSRPASGSACIKRCSSADQGDRAAMAAVEKEQVWELWASGKSCGRSRGDRVR